jgi:DNA-directed RNA polymerase subunit RPC12/RpoP
MIEFSCPVCSRLYAVPEEKARKRAKCSQCGERMIIPETTPANPDWWKTTKACPAEEEKPSPAATAGQVAVPTISDIAEVTPKAPAPQVQQPAAPTVADVAPEPKLMPTWLPKHYESTRASCDFVAGFTAFICCLGALGCVIGAFAAWDNKMTGTGWMLMGIGVACLFNIAIVNLLVGTVRVLLDIGMNIRALRTRQKEVPAS